MKAEHAHSQKHTETRKLFYQRVAAIIGQDDDINGCCVIGHTDTAILWFVLSVMIGDDCCESSNTDAIAHQMSLLTQEEP